MHLYGIWILTFLFICSKSFWLIIFFLGFDGWKICVGFGGTLEMEGVLDFVDSGHDLILATDSSAFDLIRNIAAECGAGFDEVVDFFFFFCFLKSFWSLSEIESSNFVFRDLELIKWCWSSLSLINIENNHSQLWFCDPVHPLGNDYIRLSAISALRWYFSSYSK